MDKRFREIESYPGYWVSKYGEIYSTRQKKEGRPLLQHPQEGGYQRVFLWNRETRKIDGKSVHVLVLEAFAGPCPEGMEARHLDGNASNNRLDNLKWGTRLENVEDRTKHGKHLRNAARGSRVAGVKLTEEIVRDILRSPERPSEIARRLGLTTNHVSQIKRREMWKWVEI